MKYLRQAAFFYFLLTNFLLADSRVSGDQVKLHILAHALRRYEESSGGAMPTDLISLRDYADLPWLLRPETDPLGSFPDRYAFVSALPWMEIPGEGPRQLLLICVKPLLDGSRGAIWRYRTGDYAGGILSAREIEVGLKGFDLTKLKPMGGEVPAPTHPFPEPTITDYQARVMQLVREGKITPQPRNSEGKVPPKTGDPSQAPSGNVSSKISFTPMAPSRARESPMSADERRTPTWAWVAGITAILVIVALALKRRV